MEELEQRLVWLRRPIWEWPSLPHWRPIQSVPCPAPWFCCFRDCLLASACWTRVSSNWERPWCTACLQAECSDVSKSLLFQTLATTQYSNETLQHDLVHPCSISLPGTQYSLYFISQFQLPISQGYHQLNILCILKGFHSQVPTVVGFSAKQTVHNLSVELSVTRTAQSNALTLIGTEYKLNACMPACMPFPSPLLAQVALKETGLLADSTINS